MGLNGPARRRTDDQIRAPHLRVIDADGTNLGVLTRTAALEAAADAGLHLVEVSPNAEPPVCRICDPGRLAYEESVNARRRRTGRTTRSHEVKLRPQTAAGDLRTKVCAIQRFIDAGDTVRVVVMLRGRQIGRDGDADGIIAQLTDTVERAEVDGPQRAGRDVRLTLRPRTT